MKKVCKWCGRIVEYDHECPNKPKRKDTRKKQISVDSRWRKIRQQVRERDLCCKLCWSQGVYNKIDEVHHIIPRDVATDDDHVFDVSNCIGLCHDCHVMIHREGWQKYAEKLKELICNEE